MNGKLSAERTEDTDCDGSPLPEYLTEVTVIPKQPRICQLVRIIGFNPEGEIIRDYFLFYSKIKFRRKTEINFMCYIKVSSYPSVKESLHKFSQIKKNRKKNNWFSKM